MNSRIRRAGFERNAGNMMVVATTTTSPSIHSVGATKVENYDDDDDAHLETWLIYGIVGIAVVASLALLLISVLGHFAKKRASEERRCSSTSDTISRDSWVIVCNEVPEVHSIEKPGTSFPGDDIQNPSPTLQRTTEHADAASFAAPS
ncbi:uncharacterized protein LOC119433208 [Dermacentor silvarum]|uniref:uncharacterized protein LOC119433208 n=1 Tax=Dermacentor silvarum TaxID=543639 RepID=UPI0018996B91|nr:uncharacterized protein LOC119433208 [Dermacentor silvarum]